MNAALVTAFFAAAIPAFFTPGPNNLMLMTSAARFGLGRTLPHMVGIVLGFPLMVFLVGLGLGEVFATFPVLREILKWAAAAYFLWMAWTLLGLKLHAAGDTKRPMRAHEAALFQWINPKAWAMAVSLVSLVVDAGPGRIWTNCLLTLGCLLIAPFSSALWMVFGQQLEAILKRTGTERFLGAILALLMVIAVVLFLL
ncbi:MAG TPA: LysE family translocator [Devosiaceae bacterium]|nr:LysE family translocator [Devosiaceae bacterium]